jgi:hypothetical protein
MSPGLMFFGPRFKWIEVKPNGVNAPALGDTVIEWRKSKATLMNPR